MTSDLELRQALARLDKHGDEYLLLSWPEGRPDQARVYANNMTYYGACTLNTIAAHAFATFLLILAEGIREQVPQHRIARR